MILWIFEKTYLFLSSTVIVVVAQFKNILKMRMLIQKIAARFLIIMNTKLLSHLRLGTAGLAAVTLASCSLPPRQAWDQIQRQGLIPFMMGDGQPLQINSRSTAPAPVTSPRLYASSTPSTSPIGPQLPSPPPPSMMNSATMPVASAVPDLPGYVRSPFTNPPRLVDVRGMSAGSKVVCPYTQKAFLVPGSVTSNPSPAPKIASTPAPRNTEPERPKTPAVEPNADVAALNKPAPSVTPAPQPQIKPEAPASTPELPYGTAITGRPGFVNSPYAAKHQLVDVTGLPVGMEVKCPYTGKLFRVPPQ